MKILIYGINYAPELTGIGKYTGELATFLAERGDEVEVITAPPYYPQWRVQAPYSATGWRDERRDGVRVLRCPLYVPREVSGAKRILHELTFVASSLRWWLPRLARRYDAIIAVSPPFHLGALPLVHRWLHGTPVVNHVQDLQVDAARDLGILRSERLLSVLEAAERRLLRAATRVSSISAGMIARIRGKGVAPERIVSFPNWVDARTVYPLTKEESLRRAWGIADDTRVVLYAGNLGQKQGLDALPRVAEALRARGDILFLVVGEGGTKAALVAECARRGLGNVRFEGLQPLDRLAAMLATGDAHLVLQKRAAADLVMPSKLTNIVAAGGHAIVQAEAGTTLYEVVTAHRLGTVVPPEDDAALADAIERVVSGAAAADVEGLEAYAQTLSRERILSDFREALTDCG